MRAAIHLVVVRVDHDTRSEAGGGRVRQGGARRRGVPNEGGGATAAGPGTPGAPEPLSTLVDDAFAHIVVRGVRPEVIW